MEKDELQDELPVEEAQEEEVLDEPADEPQEEDMDWRTEALKYKAIAERRDRQLKTAGVPTPKKDLPTKDEELYKTVEELALAEKKRQFGYENNLSPEETDAVFKLTSQPTKETLNDPFVKGGLASLRAKKRVENNIPSSSTRSAFKLSDKEELTPDDKQKEFEKFVQNRFKR